MTTKNLFFVLAVFWLSLPCKGARACDDTPDRGVILEAIKMVESSGNYSARGAAGERGPYQFMRTVWKQHTNAPFVQAHTTVSDLVAVRHFDWICERLKEESIPITSWNIAAAWNAGLGQLIRSKLPARTIDYANRVINIIGVSIVAPKTAAIPAATPVADTDSDQPHSIKFRPMLIAAVYRKS